VKITATITFCQLLLMSAREVMVKQLELSGLVIREESGIVPVDATVRADLVDLMARILVALFEARGDKHLYQSLAMFLIPASDGGKPSIGGVVFDAEYLRDHFFPEALDSVMSRNVAESQGDVNHAVMMIHPKMDSTPIVASAGWDDGEPEVERNWEGAFPGLVLAMKMHGTTLQAIGDRFFRQSFLILGGLSLLLAVGLGVTYRNVSKEIALARLKSDFVSNVSHELRTPFSLIRLYAETLEMGRQKTPDKLQEYYQIIRKESELAEVCHELDVLAHQPPVRMDCFWRSHSRASF
jgi:signal transduction histidine kinase